MSNTQRTGILLQTIGLALWVGGIIFLVWGVAATSFAVLPTRDLAGAMTAASLHQLNRLELLCALMVSSGLALEWRTAMPGRWYRYRVGMLVIMVGLWAAYTFGVTPAMDSLRAAVGSFDAPVTGVVNAARVRFGELHGWYSGMMMATCLTGLLSLALLGWGGARSAPVA